MANVIREDVVKIAFETNLKEITKLQDQITDLKKKLTGDMGGDSFENLKKNAKGSADSLDKVKKSAEGVNDKLTAIGKKGATAAYNGLKKVAGVSFKALTVGVTAMAGAIGKIGYEAVQAYADYEQLVGGVDTLFKDSSGTVQEYANNAYKTAGLSANAYMETVTSFSASLLQSLGGDTSEAAKYADQAIIDMADNANKMGTSMDSIQYAYQGFAKQNYTMLDNLKLGYGGTKEEMERLVKDAAKLDDSIDSNSLSYANIVKAIHAVQENMGITGTTAKEAEKTITGSLNSMKSSWGNLLTAMASGENLDQCVDNMVSSVETFAGNVMPVVEKALIGLGTVVEKIAPIIAEKLPGLAEKLLPPLIKAAIEMVNGLVKALPSIIGTIGQTIVDIFGEQFPILKKIGEAFSKNADSIAKFIPVIAGLVGAFAAFKKIKSIGSVFSGLFGKSSGGAGSNSGGLLGGLSSLAKTNTKTILKGIANISLIIVSMGALLKIATIVFKNGVDFAEMLQVTVLIGILGAVGAGLAKLAGIVGMIAIGTVLKGIANISLTVTAMGALLLLATKIFAEGVNFSEMTQVISLIGILGTIGAILSTFAGIVGLIPMPVVLTGLANMALVLGGVTAIIVAFGALSKIPGFNEFITKGGEILANIFGVIGKMVGSIIGGIGEGLTNSLPKIGENLSNFAKSLEPMFTIFSSADMSGIGTFFSALGGFLLQLGGDKILSFFTGGPDLEGLGTKLNTFAENASGFFTAVAEYPEAGFTKATQLFECLSGLSSMPNSGGLAGWFQGDVDYLNIAKGLEALSSGGVKNFFLMTKDLEQKSFDNTTALFQSLGKISELPNDGGFWGWLAGDDINLGDLGEQLSTFGEKTGTFFTQVNGLNVDNLNGLWDSLIKSEQVSANVNSVVDENITSIVNKVKALPQQMADGIKTGGESLKNSLVSIWVEAAKAMAAPVNKIIDGANWILREFGSENSIAFWTPYARGTSGHKGGNALVNDGRGAELIQMPNGRTFIPQGRNVFLPAAPKGMKVLPAEQTARLMGRKSPTFRYANGTGDIDIWSFIDDAKGLVNAISDRYVSYGLLSGFALHASRGMVNTIKNSMEPWVKGLFDEFGAKSIADYVASAGVEQWRSTVIRALQMEGQYTAANVQRTLYQMQTESGGNPMAINNWDSNAAKGTPSKGLMQVIDPTFQSYARPGYSSNIYDPLSNILASIRYAVSRYGTLENAYRGVGYSNGVGTVDLAAYTPESSGDTVINNRNKETIENTTYSPIFNLTISGTSDDRVMARKVQGWVKQAMNEMYESMNRKNRQTVRV